MRVFGHIGYAGAYDDQRVLWGISAANNRESTLPNADPNDPVQYADPQPFSVTAQGHELTFYPAGVDRLAALVEVIEGAQKSLKLFYYMFQQDHAGIQVRDALAAAAGRGVDVHLLVDRFGTDAPDSFFAPIIDNGGKYAVFSPKFSRRYLIRNHQKICIADESIAIVGGFNVSDHYFTGPADNGWKDLGCRMTGPVVDDLLDWYGKLSHWTETPGAQYRAMRKMIKEWSPRDGPVSLTLGGPTRAPNNWALQVKNDLIRASRLDMVMAYFSPPRSFRRLIRKLARRGTARLIMAGKSDNRTTMSAARATYGATLRAGARIFEFQPCKLHMKLIVLDDVVYFGSANFDYRSIRLNLEMMFRFEDAALASRMRELVDDMEAASIEVTRALHRKWRSPWTLLTWWFGWSMVSVVDYTVARGLNDDS
ncbi:MAG: phosphatidylserine/phosphatidylglycerophosphate/cardiolipin synthase family protein [Pontixanthobacter sp.]